MENKKTETEATLQSPIIDKDEENSSGEELYWLMRLIKNQDKTLVLFVWCTNFNDGVLFAMLALGNQYLYKNVYNVEPETLQIYHALMLTPLLLRIFMGLFVDAKIFNRRYYVMFFNLIPSAMNCLIAFKFVDTAGSVCLIQLFGNFFHQFLESTQASYVLEQGRGIKMGYEDIQSFSMIGLSVGMCMGSLLATIGLAYGHPRKLFLIQSSLYFIAFIQSFFINKQIDNNEKASYKSVELIIFQEQQKEKYGNDYSNTESPLKPNCMQFLTIKFKLIRNALREKTLQKFYAFLILNSIVMPTFMDFDYYFNIDVLKIPLQTVNLQQVYTGWISLLLPFIFQKYLIKKNYSYLYGISQAIFVFSESINLLLATRYNLKLGIPDIVLYYIGGSISQRIERGLGMIPFMVICSKVFPVGIEATMWCFSITIIMFVGLFCQPLVGVLINHYFIHCTTKTMENYVYIKLCRVICCMIPFFLLWIVPTLEEVEQVHKINIEKSKKKTDSDDVELTTQIN